MEKGKEYLIQGRRSSSRAAKLRRRKQRTNFILFLGAIAAIFLLAVVLPRIFFGFVPIESFQRATSGQAENDSSEVIGAYDGLVISEIMPSNGTAVTDEEGGYPDWIEIWNSTDRMINLEHVGLSDRSDQVRFLFPAVSLQPDGRVIVYCDNRNQSDPDKPFHAKFKLSSSGETVYLYDPKAYLIDSCTYPIMSSDESWSLVRMTDKEREYQAVSWFSPGYENTETGSRAYRESVSVENGSVLINEVMADPITGIRDDEEELCDWVELYNTTDHDINLNTFALSDNEGKPLKWRFPENAVIRAHDYYLVLCTGKDRIDTSMEYAAHSNFKISAEKETIILSDSQGRIVDRVMIDNLAEDCSWGRNENNQMQVFRVPTPRLPNNETGFNQMDLNLRAMNRTGIWISEVMASNSSVSTYANAGNTDWIEIYNASGVVVDISGWGLSDNLTRGRKWQFPYGTTISPGEYKVIVCDGDTAKNSVSEPHTSFKIGRSMGEVITLADATGRVLDKLMLPGMMKTDVSYGRTQGMAGLFYYDAPTPFQANGSGFSGYAPMPSFSVAPGQYEMVQYVQFNVPDGTQVFYTTDGSTPTQDSTIYNGERLELNFTTVLRARAYGTSLTKPSDVLTGTFFINAYHTLPLVSVVTDPKNLWDEEWGMLVTGKNAVKDKLPFSNTVYRKVKDAKIKYECNVEIYDQSGNLLISQGADVSLMGDYSLDMPQKSFKFRAKSKYGAKTFAAKLFPDRDYTEYKGFVLRNSGNDCMWTRLQDGFQSRLMDFCNSSIAHQSWQPYAVYLNGVYWGHMNLRERTDIYMIAQFEGLDLDEAKDRITLLQGNGTSKYGSNKEFKAMLKKIKAGDPYHNTADLQYILDNVDVDNLFEYMAFEMFFGNSDIGNTRFYRVSGEGNKWRWVLYDVDYGLYTSGFDSPKSYTKAKGMGQKNINNTIFMKLLSVPEYKDRFLQIYGRIYRQLTTDNMLMVLDELVKEIEPEMQLHWARWGEENDKAVIAEVPITVDGAYRYWEKRVERLRNVVRKRPTLLWEMTQKAFDLKNEEMIEYFGEKPPMPPEAI